MGARRGEKRRTMVGHGIENGARTAAIGSGGRDEFGPDAIVTGEAPVDDGTDPLVGSDGVDKDETKVP